MLRNSSIAALCELPPFQGLSPASLSYIATLMERRSFGKGTTLLMRQEHSRSVLFIEKGLVRVCDKSCPTTEVLIALLGPGEIIGEIHTLDGEGHSADVIVAVETVCWFMAQEDFLCCLQTIPELALNLLRLTTKRLRYTTDRIALLSTQDSVGRLALQLQILADQCGAPSADGSIEITLPLTQGDLASLTGVSRQSINSALASFRAQKAIGTHNGHLVILRPDLLERRCR